MADKAQPGMRALVPVGRSKTYTAMIFSVHHNAPEHVAADRIRTVWQLLDARPVLLPVQLKLWQWIASYYMAPLGDVYRSALPSGLKAEDGYRPRTETYVTLSQVWRSEQALHNALEITRRAPKQQNILTTYLQLSHFDTMEGTQPHEPVAEITREELINTAHATSPQFNALMKRGILTTYEKEVGRLNSGGSSHPERINALSDPQQEAFDDIQRQFATKSIVLLQGVTSSGKTEIYIHLIQQVIEQGGQVLYLLPEIALTVQITSRLQRIFGDEMGIYHSKYSDEERVEIWLKQLSNHPYKIILGARSACFLPFRNLQLVIVDEEHETSYKQQDPAPRYHARNVAIMLAAYSKAHTLLGTATPSVETYYNAQKGKYGLVKLTTRYQGVQLPKIEVVDVRDMRHRKLMSGPFSPQLIRAMREALASNQQVILFQNRRGFAPMIECRECGWVPKCHNCDVSLTYHKGSNLLTCHYCGYTYSVPDKCPNCGSTELLTRGYGTEKIEEEVLRLFPEARVARMDLDTTHTRNAYSRIINNFSSGKTQVLIGTQMVTKGLDFDRVSIVGILNADAMLQYPDFRAYEHAFTMMLQVAGRAGRRGTQGHVILQTKNTDLPVIAQVVNHNYTAFFNDVLQERHQFNYPPFSRLVYIYLKHRNEQVVDTAAIELGSLLRQGLGERVLGPDKPAVARVKTLFIRKLVVKIENAASLSTVKQYMWRQQQRLLTDKRYATLQIYYDVDPV